MTAIALFYVLFGLNGALVTSGASTRREIDKIKFRNMAASLWAANSNTHAVNSVEAARFIEDSKSILKVKEPNRDVLTSELPAEFNAATAWPKCQRITHPRNQGNCRSDWAVAAASVLTDRLCIYFWSLYNEPLSAYHVLTCCKDCGDGCKSGSAANAWKFFEKEGVVTGGDRHSQVGCLPYQLDPCDYDPKTKGHCSLYTPVSAPTCPNACIDNRYNFTNNRVFVSRSYAIANDVGEIQKEIIRNGPVQASILVYDDLLYCNGDEVYSHTLGGLQGGASIKIIGWGVDADSKIDYWLVVASWGSNLGQKGTFRIKRGTDECGIESNVIAGDPSMNHSAPNYKTL